MNKNTRNLARAAMLTALGAALLYVSAVVPTARVALVAVAGMLTAAATISCGAAWGWGVFAVTAALALVLLPLKSCAVLYAAFLGWYPVGKSALEHIKSRPLEWAAKFILFNAALTALYFLARGVLTDGGLPDLEGWMVLAAYLILNAVFLAYDILLSRLIALYITRIAGKLFKRGENKR